MERLYLQKTPRREIENAPTITQRYRSTENNRYSACVTSLTSDPVRYSKVPVHRSSLLRIEQCIGEASFESPGATTSIETSSARSTPLLHIHRERTKGLNELSHISPIISQFRGRTSAPRSLRPRTWLNSGKRERCMAQRVSARTWRVFGNRQTLSMHKTYCIGGVIVKGSYGETPFLAARRASRIKRRVGLRQIRQAPTNKTRCVVRINFVRNKKYVISKGKFVRGGVLASQKRYKRYVLIALGKRRTSQRTRSKLLATSREV